MGEAKRVGIYLRVSTAEQNTALQLVELSQYVDSRGWSDSSSVYEDRLTGTNGNWKRQSERK